MVKVCVPGLARRGDAMKFWVVADIINLFVFYRTCQLTRYKYYPRNYYFMLACPHSLIISHSVGWPSGSISSHNSCHLEPYKTSKNLQNLYFISFYFSFNGSLIPSKLVCWPKRRDEGSQQTGLGRVTGLKMKIYYWLRGKDSYCICNY